jgi:histidinol phosphatase-like enzyme
LSKKKAGNFKSSGPRAQITIKGEKGMKKVPLEIFSRSVGYFRPVNQWNKGKQEEYKERNQYSPEDVEKVNSRMLELLGQAGCSSIDGIYYSTTNLKEDTFAKPNVGMFKRAETELGVKFKGGAYVGDKLSDLKAADKSGAIPILVRTGHGTGTELELNKFTYRELKKKTMIFDDLWSFAESLPWNE